MINDGSPIPNIKDKRRKLSGVDNPVLQADQFCPAGRTYRSTTFETPVPTNPHILPNVRSRHPGIQVMISVNVEPVNGQIPELSQNVPYEETIQYHNRSNMAIKVTTRQNLTVTIPKNRTWHLTQKEYFVVRKIHRFNSSESALSVLYNYGIDQPHLSIENDERETVLKRLSEAQQRGELRNPQSHIEVTVDRILPIQLFTEYASIYLSDIDAMFRMEGVDVGSPHPTSQDAILRGEVLETVGDRRISGAFYEIVDNESKYSSRYVCLGKKVVQVPIHRDPGKTPGIYHTEINNINVDNLNITMSHLPLDKAEEIGIYQTLEEAETKGHVGDAHKVKMAELERELKEKEAENRKIQTERDAQANLVAHERRMRETEIAMQKTEQSHEKDQLSVNATMIETMLKLQRSIEQDKIEREAAKRKEEAEERAALRKDTSEILKWIPTLITATATIATAVVVVVNASNKK